MIENDNTTLWCGNLSEQVTEELLYELFLQAGPLKRVSIARDKDGRQKSYGFITYCHEVSVPYAIELFRDTALFHRTLLLQCRGQMPTLPPPIRCFGPNPNLEYQTQPQQLLDLPEKLPQQEYNVIHALRQGHDNLTIDSLKGNWTRRHQPYRTKEMSHSREDYRSRDSHNKLKAKEHWHGRRNHKKSNNYHR